MASRWWVQIGSLIVIYGLLVLPNLGEPSLWDMDEGVNAGCTREMIESGTWVVPTFNWKLRTAKPILTYWLQHPFSNYWARPSGPHGCRRHCSASARCSSLTT